jgi:regulatory factor X
LTEIRRDELFVFTHDSRLIGAQFNMAHSPTHKTEEAPDMQDLSHTNNETSNKEKHRPKSRGSTTSLQSVAVGSAFQPAPQRPQQQDDSTMPLDQNSFFMQHGHHPAAAMYGQNPEEMLMHYQPHMAAGMRAQSIDLNGGMPPHDIRPMSQQAFQDMQPYPMQYAHGMPAYAVGPQHMHHMRHQSEQFEGSPAPDDSNTENGGPKRRKGTTSSAANDQELRRLLSQYKGRSLKEVAAEVQKNEGSGGKSEKAKQVFAMLWYVS